MPGLRCQVVVMLPSGSTCQRPLSIVGTASARRGASRPSGSKLLSPLLTSSSSVSPPWIVPLPDSTPRELIVGGLLSMAASSRFGEADADCTDPAACEDE